MIYSRSLQQCNIVTSRFGNKQQMLRKIGCPRELFVLHWDAKMYPEIRGVRSMDRTAVLVIGYGYEKLPNVSHGTGGGACPSRIDFVQEHHMLE